MKEGCGERHDPWFDEGLEKGEIEALSDLLKERTISIQDTARCMAMSTDLRSWSIHYSV